MKRLISGLVVGSLSLLMWGGLSVPAEGQFTSIACNDLRRKLNQYNIYLSTCSVVESNEYLTKADIGGKGGFYYIPQKGRCTTVNYYGKVVQNVNTCRKSWYAIGKVKTVMVFFDKSTGEIETYMFSGDTGIQERVQRIYSPGNKAVKAMGVSSPGNSWGGRDWTLYFQNERGGIAAYVVDSNNKLKLVKEYP